MLLKLITNHYIEIAYIICAMLGGVMHWLKKSFNGETDSKIQEWFGSHNLPATIYTLTVFVFAIIGTLAGDIINSQTSFWAAMYTGFVTGFAIDSGFNRDIGDMNRDLIKSRDEIRQLIPTKDTAKTLVKDEETNSTNLTNSTESDSEEPQQVVKLPTLLTVEERRLALRNKLKG